MYNPILNTFITVIDCGSFTKAAEQLNISTTAIMKQMNTLEKHLNLKLIDRTPTGVNYTQAGKIIYRDAKFIIDYSKKSITEATAAASDDGAIFRAGTSRFAPARAFMDLWYQVSPDFPGSKLQLVSFEDDSQGLLPEIKKLGKTFDFLISICDSEKQPSMCNCLPIGKYKEMIAIPKDHPLAAKEMIDIEDLYGKTLMIMSQGISLVHDKIREDFAKNHPQIHLEDIPHNYDLSVFQRCIDAKNALLIPECLKNILPDIISLPVHWDYSVPYGILYSLNSSENVLNFIKAAKNLLS